MCGLALLTSLLENVTDMEVSLLHEILKYFACELEDAKTSDYKCMIA